MRPIFLISILSLASCASIEPHEFVGPNGDQAYSMRCSGMGRTLEACYQKAGEVCPNGYTIIDLNTATFGVPSGDSVLIAARQTMAIECKAD